MVPWGTFYSAMDGPREPLLWGGGGGGTIYSMTDHFANTRLTALCWSGDHDRAHGKEKMEME